MDETFTIEQLRKINNMDENNWVKGGMVKGWQVWGKWADGQPIYQVTTGCKPKYGAGYSNLKALLKLKGIQS